MRESFLSRRELLKAAVAITISSSLPGNLLAQETKNQIPFRKLGKTGEKVSIIGVGGFHIGQQEDEKESIKIIRSALDSGINFLDNCWDYNDGQSEIRMGKALQDGYREKAFLMTKIDGRDKKTAENQLNESLKRLKTDRIDLMQFHEIIHPNDPELIFGKGGALEAVLDAKKAGKIRFIGFTGHKSPEFHLKMLDTAAKHDFSFDTVQMPLNVMDAHFLSFEKKVLPRLIKEDIGVLGMKSMGDGIILGPKAVSPQDCLKYAMSLPVSVVITGIDSIPILEQAVQVANNFKPLTEQQVTELLSKTAKYADKGEYELYKTSTTFDGTSKHPEWLGKIS